MAMLEDAPMGSDHDANSQNGGVGPDGEGEEEDDNDVVYVDDNEMA